MKILITGSSGLIGSCLSKRLRKKHEVFGLDLKRSPDRKMIGCFVMKATLYFLSNNPLGL
jgi:nucleoside-diphosphate-sugar epimerase